MSGQNRRSRRYRVYVGISAGIIVLGVASLVAAVISGSLRQIGNSGVVFLATLAFLLWMRKRSDI